MQAPQQFQSNAESTRSETLPTWLQSDYGSPQWRIADESGKIVIIDFDVSLPNRIRLTDPENSELLATIRKYALEIRTGPHASVVSANCHRTLVGNLITTVHWAKQQHIHSLRSWTRSDVRAFVAAARFGVESLLDGAPTLQKYVRDLRSNGGQVPTRRSPLNGLITIDVGQLLDDASLPRSLSVNERIAWVVAQTTDAMGLPARWKHGMPREEECPERAVLQQEPLRKILRPLEDLFQMRFRIDGDNITFPPYYPSASNVSQQIGMASGRTATIPQPQALYLVEKAARWVLDYAPYVLALVHKTHELFKRSAAITERHRWRYIQKELERWNPGISSEGMPYPIVVGRRRKGLQLNTALRYLGTACIIIIAVFVGRRKGEILGAEAGCVSRTAEGLWLETMIEKSLRRKDRTPCPEIVECAVSVLDRMSASARALSGTCVLSQFVNADPTRRMKLTISELNNFATYVGVPPLPDGSVWIFSSHQFRRMFAIIYFWRWADGDLPSLAHHLRHFNVAMTQRYVTEAEAGAIMVETERCFTTKVLTEVALGERTLYGQAGIRVSSAVKRLTDRFRRKVRVVDPSRISALVARYSEKVHLGLHPNQFVFCVCKMDSPAPNASCRPNGAGIGPDFSSATASACTGCKFSLMTQKQVEAVETELSRDIAYATDIRLPTLLREAAARRIEQLRVSLATAKHRPDDA